MEQAFRQVSSLTPITVVNKFLLANPQLYSYLVREDALNGSKLEGIYPTQSSPETLPPYLMYHYLSDAHNAEQWWQFQDEIRYFVYSEDVSVVDHISRIIRAMMSRADNTARELNDFQKSEFGSMEYKFSYTQFMGQIDPQHATEEGGLRHKAVLFKVCYTPTDGPGLL